MRDIESRVDVEFLINSFYGSVKESELIGYIFTEIAKVDWELHLPKMYDFWEAILLDSNNYNGNPMAVHVALNKKNKLEKKHFDKWQSLWKINLKSNFEGPVADEALKRAHSIAELMFFKVEQSNSIGSQDKFSGDFE